MGTPARIAQIHGYWEQKAAGTATLAPAATMKDVILRELEIAALSRQLRRRDRVIDLGCGNGFSSFRFARLVRHLHGVDYSAAMVAQCERARRRRRTANIDFAVGDVTRLDAGYAGSFDVAITERCLINLPDWRTQQRAIREIHRTLRPGGRFLMLEGIAEHFAQLNRLRTQCGLPAIRLDWHNRLFARRRLFTFLRSLFTVTAEIDFGAYYVVSRVVHPLAVAPAEPQFTAPCNRAAAQLAGLPDAPAWRDSSINVLLVLTKRAATRR